jgi:hypothetical protein
MATEAGQTCSSGTMINLKYSIRPHGQSPLPVSTRPPHHALLMEGGRVTFQTAVSLDRPRDRASAEFTALKEVILERIIGAR